MYESRSKTTYLLTSAGVFRWQRRIPWTSWFVYWKCFRFKWNWTSFTLLHERVRYSQRRHQYYWAWREFQRKPADGYGVPGETKASATTIFLKNPFFKNRKTKCCWKIFLQAYAYLPRWFKGYAKNESHKIKADKDAECSRKRRKLNSVVS